MTIDDHEPSSLNITVMSTSLGFKRVETHCNAEILCDKLVLLRPKTNPLQKSNSLQLFPRSMKMRNMKVIHTLNMMKRVKSSV